MQLIKHGHSLSRLQIGVQSLAIEEMKNLSLYLRILHSFTLSVVFDFSFLVSIEQLVIV